MDKKGKLFKCTAIITTVMIVIVLFSLLAYFFYNKNADEIQRKSQEELKNAIVEMNYGKYIESIDKVKDNNFVFEKIMNVLKESEEKMKNNPNEDDFNRINEFYTGIISNERNLFSQENIDAIEKQKKYIDYYFYINISDKLMENEGYSYLSIISNYDNAVKLFKDDSENEELYNNAKQKYASIIEKVNEELLNEVNSYIDNEDYNGGYEYLTAHEEEYHKINSALLHEKYVYEQYKYHIDLPVDENGHGELFNKSMIIFSKINEEKERIKEEKKAAEKAAKKQEGVKIGMSQQDVLDSSWGEPTKINKSVYSWGTTEQWVYPNYNYLYFENGKLTSIQTNE